MAGQAILGEMVLNHAISTAAAPTIESLVAGHAGMVFRIAYSILRNHHDAEDAAQECFLRVLKHQGRLHKIRNAKTWLARVAWTTALDKRRSQPPAAASLDDEAFGEPMLESLPDSAPRADDQIAGRQMQRLLQRLIAALPDDLRQPLELSTVQELNSVEIAEVMEIPEASVRTRLFRARKLLKEKLASQLEAKHV